MKPTPEGWPRLSSAVFYNDAATAIDWLCRAFGFDVRLKVEGDNGRIEHSELVYGEALIMVGQAGANTRRPNQTFPTSPKSVGGANTQSLMLFVGRRRCPLRPSACGRRDDFRRTRRARLRRRLLVRPELRCRGSRGTSLVVHAATARSTAVMSNASYSCHRRHRERRPSRRVSTGGNRNAVPRDDAQPGFASLAARGRRRAGGSHRSRNP